MRNYSTDLRENFTRGVVVVVVVVVAAAAAAAAAAVEMSII